jgi:hypothetical protein
MVETGHRKVNVVGSAIDDQGDASFTANGASQIFVASGSHRLVEPRGPVLNIAER